MLQNADAELTGNKLAAHHEAMLFRLVQANKQLPLLLSTDFDCAGILIMITVAAANSAPWLLSHVQTAAFESCPQNLSVGLLRASLAPG